MLCKMLKKQAKMLENKGETDMKEAIIKVEHLNKQFVVDQQSMEVLRDINLLMNYEWQSEEYYG